MDRKPIKRHPALVPLSRQHHKGLILAQLLKKDVPDYRGLPSDIPGKVIYAKAELGRLAQHFEWEANVLIPASRPYSDTLNVMAGQVLADQHAIKELIQSLTPDATLERLDQIGQLLEQHIRFEERVWFAAIQETLPETVLERLAPLEME